MGGEALYLVREGPRPVRIGESAVITMPAE